MRFSSFRHAAVAASLFRFTAAQNSVPADLKGDGSNEIQVSYTGEAQNGFRDGTSFTKDQVAKEPEFALGDSDGIAPANLFTIVMIDTTNDNARKLHYVRTNFKHSEGVKLASQTQALFEYKAPGTLGETGNEAKYTFLLYGNPERNQIQSMNLPGDDEAFDVRKFQDDNGLNDPNAAIGMVVKLDGAAAEPSASSSSSQRTSASIAPSSTAATASLSPTTAPSSTTSATRATSSIVQGAPSSTTVPSSGASTNTGSRPSSQASASTSGAAEQPQDQGQTSAARPTSNIAPTVATPTTVSLSRVPGTSATASELPALQTGNTGAMLSLPYVHRAVLAPVVVLAGFFV